MFLPLFKLALAGKVGFVPAFLQAFQALAGREAFQALAGRKVVVVVG